MVAWVGSALLSALVASIDLDPRATLALGAGVPLLARLLAGYLLRPWARDTYRRAAAELVSRYG